jgi:hypothetical protein
MQNRNNIDERLQILNDYIQRTIDPLNATRQVAAGLSNTTIGYQTIGSNVPGLSHSSVVGYGVPQFVQTPQGWVQVSSGFSPVSQLGVPQWNNVGYGVSYGLNHAQFMPQMQVASWPMTYGQNAFSQVSPFGYNVAPSLNHAQFVQSPVVGMPMTFAQWPVNVAPLGTQVGFNHSSSIPMQQVSVQQPVMQQSVMPGVMNQSSL